MAKRIFSSGNMSFAAIPQGSAATASAYMALQGGANMLVDVLEITVSGKVGSSTVAAFYFGRASTGATTPTALSAPNSDGPLYPGATALSTTVAAYIAASTNPTPSNATTDAKLELGINGFGGIFRWNAAPTQQWQMFAATAAANTSMLYNCSGAGGVTCAADGHIIYEPY